MKLRSLLILLLCVLVLVQTADGKKRKRKKPKVKPTTRAPTTTTTRAPTLQTDPSTSYTPQVAGACRRTCERNSYLMPDRCVCVCNQGYEYSSRTGYCEDIDECADESNCVGGACTNSRGSYYCICPVGYNLHANGKLCLLEPRVMSCRGLVCFDGAELDELRCRCWCSDPGLTYDYFEEKCQDINECMAGSHNCEHGCINTEGSFMCYCVSGFQLDADGTTCLPSPPPDPSTIPCFGKCPGATALNLLNCNCMCETGFVYGEDELECVDRDECRDYQGWCQGVCENTPGSYTCTCPTGTVLDADGWTCNEPVSSSGEFECFDYEILCDHGNQCVQEGVICDGYSDCSDGSDERQCKPVCRPDQFSCANGRACLEATQRCNGENDCLDFSDELDCPCKDEKDECHAWRNRGECESNPGWMNWNCRESCKTCMKDDGTESGVVEESELPMLFFLRNSEDFASTLQYTLRNTGNREGASGSEWLCHTVTEVPIAVRAQFRLSYAYRKYAQAYNIPILGTARANEDAMTRACYVVRFLLADRRDLREALYRAWGRIAVMDDDEVTVNIPEHSHLPELYNSLRGLGGTLHIPVASGATENLICLENDPNSGQDMFVHTMAHTIRRVSITTMTSTYNSRLLGAYVNARKTDLWANTRAQYTADEYFAQGVMSFFNVITDSEIDSREKLQRYDPALYNLVKEVFPCMNTIVDRCDADQSKIYTEQIRMNCNERGEPDRQLDPDTMAEDVCRNLHHECPQWKNDGGCQNNAVWMSTHCPKSCGTCPEPEEEPVDGPSIELGRDDEGNIKFKEPSDCQDADDQCLQWVQEGRCETHAGWMEIFCEKSCSMCEDQEEIVLRENDSDNEEQTPLPPDEAQCVDSHFLCEINAKAGECTTNEFWMRKHCPLSCHFCIDISVSHFTCQDSDPVCHELAKEGNCEVEWIKANCKKSCGTCPATEEKITTSAPTPVPVDEYTCVDIDPICTEWADEGECMNNPRYMEENCPVSCSYCSNSETKEEQSQYEFIPTPANEPESVCADLEPHCIGWAESGECVYSPEYMQVNCPASCGFCKGPGVKPVKPNCVDHDRYCPDWASEGDCATNPEWMLVNCKLSCGICDDPLIPADSDCFDTDQYCIDWAESGNCETDRHWMFVNCPQSCGLCDGSQIPPKPTISTQTSSYHYEPNCKDSDALCPGWAFYGGCYQNPEWMLPNCAYSCNSCHYIVTNDTQVDPEPSEQPLSCSDKHARCQDLATTGGCLTIPEWMTEHCPVSCNMCGDREIVTHLPPPAKTNYPTDDENMAVTSTASLGEVEESENSDASEWTGDWIHTSDSWRESQITQVWEDSQSDDSSDDNSDLTAEASMIDIPEEGFSINIGVFTNEDVTQSPVSVSKSQDSITVPGSVLSTKITEKMSTSRDESAQPPNSVTPSFHSFTSLSSSLTDSLGEVPPTVFHEVSKVQTTDPVTRDKQLSKTDGKFTESLTQVLSSSPPPYVTKPQKELTWKSTSGTTYRTGRTTEPEWNPHQRTPKYITSSPRMSTISFQKGGSMPTSTNDKHLFTEATDKLWSNPTPTQRTIPVTVPAIGSSSVSTIDYRETSTDDLADKNVRVPTATTQQNDSHSFTSEYKTQTFISEVVTINSNRVTQVPEEEYTLSTLADTDLRNDVSDSKNTQSSNILTTSKHLQYHTTLEQLLHKLTPIPPENGTPVTLPEDTTEQTTVEMSTFLSEVLKISTTEQPVVKSDCNDKHKNCPVWAFHGSCISSSSYMHHNCKASCNLCEATEDESILPQRTTSPIITNSLDEGSWLDCKDSSKYCSVWASYGGCTSNPRYMLPNCRRSCNSCDFISSLAEEVDDNISGSDNDNLASFNDDESFIPTAPPSGDMTTSWAINKDCKDTIAFCTTWAKHGGCTENPEWMLPKCRKSCNSCDFVEEPKDTLSESMDESYSEPTSLYETTTNRVPVTQSNNMKPTDPSCADSNANCEYWGSIGECAKNPVWMERNCQKTCHTCQNFWSDCYDDYGPACEGWANIGECEANPYWMKKNCRKSCHTCNDTFNEDLCADNYEKCPKWKEEGECDYDVDWMRSNCKRSCGLCALAKDEKQCLDSFDNCTQWAEDGECDGNPVWMRINCCLTCLEREPTYCVDKDERCVQLRKDGACNFDREWMLEHCRMSCEACNISNVNIPHPRKDCVDDGDYCAELALEGECETDREWMKDHCCHSCSLMPEDFIPGCADTKRDCSKWAEAGECDTNKNYMTIHCAKSCNKCSECIDTDDSLCLELASKGRCVADPGTMLAYCPKTCNMCF